MDRKEKPKRSHKPAHKAEANRSDGAGPAGSRSLEQTSIVPEDAEQPVAGHPRSEVTSRHDEGSGGDETPDGLAPAEEALRRGAEDTPIGAPAPEPEDLPVFDRGGALPKV